MRFRKIKEVYIECESFIEMKEIHKVYRDRKFQKRSEKFKKIQTVYRDLQRVSEFQRYSRGLSFQMQQGLLQNAVAFFITKRGKVCNEMRQV